MSVESEWVPGLARSSQYAFIQFYWECSKVPTNRCQLFDWAAIAQSCPCMNKLLTIRLQNYTLVKRCTGQRDDEDVCATKMGDRCCRLCNWCGRPLEYPNGRHSDSRNRNDFTMQNALGMCSATAQRSVMRPVWLWRNIVRFIIDNYNK